MQKRRQFSGFEVDREFLGRHALITVKISNDEVQPRFSAYTTRNESVF
jgi:hypothetical protein